MMREEAETERRNSIKGRHDMHSEEEEAGGGRSPESRQSREEEAGAVLIHLGGPHALKHIM